jgi:hypothetical protein
MAPPHVSVPRSVRASVIERVSPAYPAVAGTATTGTATVAAGGANTTGVGWTTTGIAGGPGGAGGDVGGGEVVVGGAGGASHEERRVDCVAERPPGQVA